MNPTDLILAVFVGIGSWFVFSFCWNIVEKALQNNDKVKIE